MVSRRTAADLRPGKYGGIKDPPIEGRKRRAAARSEFFHFGGFARDPKSGSISVRLPCQCNAHVSIGVVDREPAKQSWQFLPRGLYDADERACMTDPLSMLSRAFLGPRGGRACSMPRPRGVQVAEGRGSFYAVRKGEAWLTSPHWSQPVRLKVGDIALIPRGRPRCGTMPGGGAVVDFDQFTAGNDATRMEWQRPSRRHEIIDGIPWHTGPPLIPACRTCRRARTSGSTTSCVKWKVCWRCSKMNSVASIRRQAIAKQLIQVIFYQSLRAFLTGTDQHLEAEGSSMQAVVSDPSIGGGIVAFSAG